MIPVSTWYDSLGQFTFPTVFIALKPVEIIALLEGNNKEDTSEEVVRAGEKIRESLSRAIRALPGNCFVGADVCAPVDSVYFPDSTKVSTGSEAWEILRSSNRVKEAFKEERTKRLTVRPYRKMNRIREFRLFFYERYLVAMSQMNLERHFARFAKRRDYLWNQAWILAEEINEYLPEDNLVVDIYFCSNGEILVVDMNKWGPPTDPLLLRSWDQDWRRQPGLKLIPPPANLGGDVSVSF